MEREKLYRILGPHTSFATRYYVFNYGQLPTIKTFRCQIKTDFLCQFLKEKYPLMANEVIHNKNYYLKAGHSWDNYEGSVLSVIRERFIMYYEDQSVTICHDDTVTDAELDEIKCKLLELAKQNNAKEHKFSMIKKRDYEGYELAEFNSRKVDVNIGENYNEDLVKLNDNIIHFLNEPERNGIILFHGLPGTGKTNYLRYLITQCTPRFIYLPNNLFTHISDPDFIAFIASFPDSVIILEDCEELLKSREGQQAGNGITNILNLGDGLLGDALKLKIICTFNCELSKLDSAILRKGRLAYRYEFGKLEAVKVNQLLAKQDINEKVSEPLTLAEVYNFTHENNGNDSVKKVIGFSGN